MKMLTRLLAVLVVALPSWAACSPSRLTEITGTLYLPNGSGYNGQLTIGWGNIPWQADDGTLIPSGPPIALQIKNGAVSVCLQPTDGTTVPTPIQYTVIYRPAGSGAITQYWEVPTSASPVTLSSVIVPATSNPPVSSGIISLNGLTSSTQLLARVNDTNVTMTIGSSLSTHTFTLGWTGQCSAARGCTGDDTSAVTGVPLITAGNWTYAAAASNLSGWPAGVDMTEVGYLNGVTSAIQTQMDGKLALTGGTLTGALLLSPASGAYAVDITKSGSSGTFRCWDQLATTGSTNCAFRAGEGQSGPVVDVINFSGTRVAGMYADGTMNASLVNVWETSGYANRIVLGNPAGYMADIQKSGSSGTLRVYDQTAVTGDTSVGIRAGAGQSVALTSWSDNSNNALTNINADGTFWRLSSGAVKIQLGTNVDVASTGLFRFYDGANIFGASVDTALSRNAAGVVEVNNGTPGTFRDLRARNVILTTSTPASAAATGVEGTIAWDSSYIYIATGTNTWKRVAIATWP